MREFLEAAANVRPSRRILDWYDTEFYAFIHFGPNTFTNQEWGSGQESPSVFHPTNLDCDQWVDTIKKAGMKGMVLTAKHHDGFCLWPSQYTEHSVKNAPVKIDVVKEAAEACKRGGIKFGFYLSPWDRNSKLYGTEGYNDYFCNQLTELLTSYGDIFYVWFDNACGEGPNGKRQEYDFPRYIELIRKYQPNAVIFNDFGPDIRWCGNEAGVAREAEWAVVPSELCHYSEVQTGPGPLADSGDLEFLYNTNQDIGQIHNIMYSKGLTFTPAEINMSIRPGWFWHPHEEPHSLERLFRTYLTSVGSNGCFHLNLPPTTEGRIDQRDVIRLQELKALIDKELGEEIPCTIRLTGEVESKRLQSPQRPQSSQRTQAKYEIRFDEARNDFKYVILREDLTQGQRIESFQIEAESEGGNRFPFYQGRTVGNRKICQLLDPFVHQNPLTRVSEEKIKRLIVHVTSARAKVKMKSITIC